MTHPQIFFGSLEGKFYGWLVGGWVGGLVGWLGGWLLLLLLWLCSQPLSPDALPRAVGRVCVDHFRIVKCMCLYSAIKTQSYCHIMTG